VPDLEIRKFISPPEDDVIFHLADEMGFSPEYLKTEIKTFINEAYFGYTVLRPELQKGMRILEVGGGLALLSSYLQHAGYKVSVIEPVGSSFSLFHHREQIFSACFPKCELPEIFPVNVEDINRETHGVFDLVFSINVLEHVNALEQAFYAMKSVLNKDGRMLHACPNYFVPYEPHFSLPLIPFFPGLSKTLFPKKINTDLQLWESLNFISSGDVAKLARKNDLAIKYLPGTFYRALKRLGEDDLFSQRHNIWIRAVYRIMMYSKLIGLTKYLPPRLITPMVFVLNERKGNQ